MTDDRRFDQNKMHALIGPEREARWQPSEFLKRLSLQPGQSVLDLGSGPGLWTLPLAEIVSADGVVWALDVSQDMLDLLMQRNPPTQVRTLQAELPQIELPTGSLDYIWAAFVLHEVTPLEEMVRQMRRLLNENGVLAVLDWSPSAEGGAGPPSAHRISAATLSKQLLDAGFASVRQTWQDTETYLLEALVSANE